MAKVDIGQIVYVVRREYNDFYIQIGIVDEIFNEHSAKVDFLTMREMRTINGVPIKEFHDDKYHKLPKGWTYNTPLYDIGYEPIYNEVKIALKGVNQKDTAAIKEAYNKGYMVKIYDTFTGHIDVEITKEGYRVFQSHWNDHTVPGYTYPMHQIYESYDEAQKWIDDYNAELERQASLTYEEWSLEQIDDELARWKYIYSRTDKDVQKVREYLLSLGDVASLEVRTWKGNVQ